MDVIYSVKQMFGEQKYLDYALHAKLYENYANRLTLP